jgi:hypothetical protein
MPVGICAALVVIVTSPKCAHTDSDVVHRINGTRGVIWPRSSSRSVETLLTLIGDLVFVGRLESCRQDTASGSEAHTLVRCRIDSVLVGFSPDSFVTFDHFRPAFAPEVLAGRPRIFGFVSRACMPSGTGCGGFFLMGADGILLSDDINDDDEKAARTDTLPLRLKDINLERLHAHGLQSLLLRGDGLAIVVLEEGPRFEPIRVPIRDAAVTMACEAAEWMVPTSAAIPRHVRLISRGLHSTSGADHFLIPVPRNFKGDTLNLDCYPRLLAVHRGQVKALGLSLERLRDWLKPAPGGGLMLVRPLPARR